MILVRRNSTMAGTPGTIILGDGTFRSYRSIELPWRDNERDISCIPPGGPYPLELLSEHVSEKFPYTHIAVRDVPGRSGIRIHRANWAGAKDKGYKSEMEGCIAPGMTSAWRRTSVGGGQPGVGNSTRALKQLVSAVATGDSHLYIFQAGDRRLRKLLDCGAVPPY